MLRLPGLPPERARARRLGGPAQGAPESRSPRYTPGPCPRPSRSLLRHPDFLKLWTAETVSVFGTAITQLALPIIAATYPAGHAVRVRPAHDDRVPAVHPAQPAGRRLGGPAPAPPDPDRRRPGPGGRDRVHPGRLLLRRPHDLAAVRRRLRQRLPHGLLRRRLPELPAVARRAGPAGGRQLEARDHAVRGADPRARAWPASSSGCSRRRSRCSSTRCPTSGRRPSCSGSGGRSRRWSPTTRRSTGRSRRCARRSRSACATSPATAGCGPSPPRRARPTSSATSSARS